jgi:osmotically-inducible protein OsmY
MGSQEICGLARKVSQALAQASCLDPTGIEIEVREEDRWIYLEGTVPASWDKERAEGLVTSVPEVAGVTNNLSVRRKSKLIS